MIIFAVFFALGVFCLQQQANLPEFTGATLLWIFPLALLLPRRWWLFRLPLLACCAFAMGFFHANWQAQQRLAQALPADWQGRDIQIIGVVAELPRIHERGYRFNFDVEQTLTSGATIPERIYLSTYNKLIFHAGERWQLTIRLKQPHGSNNPYGFDFELWALENNIRATGYVHNKGDNRRLDEMASGWLYQIESWREKIRTYFKQTLGNAPYQGVLTALAIGDQSSIPQAQWSLFNRTGIGHLISISGLHITILSGLFFTITYWLWRRSTRLTLTLPARKAAAIVAFLTALAYALLAGYAVPAQRTVYMVGAVTVALWLNRQFSLGQILSIALLGVLVLDPLAILAPGFWLSFGAVAIILFVTSHRLPHPDTKHPWQILRSYAHMQWALTIGLIPLLLLLFQQISLISPIANAFAVPLVSLVVVPLTLISAFFPIEAPLWLAHGIMEATTWLLQQLDQLPQAVWIQHAPPLWSIAAGIVGAIWLLLPAGFPAKWLGLLMMLPMFLNTPSNPAFGSARLIIFDVGQGLAIAVRTQQHALLFDAGPDFSGDADSGNRILLPNLRAMGIGELDTLILSHDDSDHTGGAASILQELPTKQILSSFPYNQAEHCLAGQRWNWDGVTFEILHPSIAFYQGKKVKDNDLSCVLKVSIGEHDILITGDIEKRAEAALLRAYGEQLLTTLLVAPHHGSKSSSTLEFISHTLPDHVVFTVGYRNQFGHPKPEIIQRYLDSGAKLLRSDQDGAILVDMDQNGVRLNRQRDIDQRYWQHSYTGQNAALP